MNLILIIIPILIISLIFVMMIPVIRKSKKAGNDMLKNFANSSVFVNVIAGKVSDINGEVYNNPMPTYGFDNPEELRITLTPSFNIGRTHYEGNSEILISFTPQNFHVYNIEVISKKPKDDEFISYYEITDDSIVFKSKFYIVVKDITETKDGQLQLRYSKKSK